MEYRNIFIANPAKLSIQRNQLVIQQEQQFTVPLEDISSILIESQQVTRAAKLRECCGIMVSPVVFAVPVVERTR